MTLSQFDELSQEFDDDVTGDSAGERAWMADAALMTRAGAGAMGGAPLRSGRAGEGGPRAGLVDRDATSLGRSWTEEGEAAMLQAATTVLSRAARGSAYYEY